MGLFAKLFGGSDPLMPLRRARRQNAWADLLARGEALGDSPLEPKVREEYDALMTEAGDALALINLLEAEAFRRAGDPLRAAEHFELAASQARSEELVGRISLSRTEDAPPCPPPVSSAAAGCCPTGCGPSGTHSPDPAADHDLDHQTRMELVLAGYPSSLSARYAQMSHLLQEAFLLCHEGRTAEAANLFAQIPASLQDDLFHFERGGLRARTGDAEGAIEDLEKTLALNPSHALAAETLVDLELACGRVSSAERRLRSFVSDAQRSTFGHGRLAAIESARGNPDKALEHGLLALPGGDPQVVLLTASLLEKAGRLPEAEQALGRLPSGGCSGGNLPLAEFWVRHRMNLDKALSAFKGALRQDPDNPRWLLRIAQAYLARGWDKEALAPAQRVLAAVDPDSGLSQEARDVLAACRVDRSP